jgi:uncharacterized membrane protein YidH (DUF202 family)
MITVKPNEQRARIAVSMIWVVLALELLSLGSGFMQYQMLLDVARGAAISTEAANSNDSREQIISLLYLVGMIISAITFIRWFRRAYSNLHQKATYVAHAEYWAAISWFIPIICLYRPYQIMKELYQKTNSLLTVDSVPFSDRFSPKFLALWWGLWITNSALGQFVWRYSAIAKTVDQFMLSTLVSMCSNLIGIPLALLTIKVIKDYAQVEPLLRTESTDTTTIIW